MRIPARRRNFLLIILAFLFFSLVYHYYVKKDMSDFGVCYRGGQRIIKGETLYRTSDGHLQYKYAPTSALFFAFFTVFPYEIAKYIWYMASLFLLFLVLYLSYDVLPSKQKKRGFVLILAFLIVAKYAGREIELGQVNIFMIFLLLMMLKAMLSGKDVQAGLFWSFSLIFKPYGLIFLPYFILKKRIKLIASGLGCLVLGLLLSVPFYGFEKNILVLKDWQRTLSRSTPRLLAHYDNASLYAFFVKNLPEGSKSLALGLVLSIAVLLGLSLLWMMFVAKRRGLEKPEVLDASFLFILIPLFSPLSWNYNYLYSILAVVFLLNVIDAFPKAMKYALIADLVAIGGSLREVLGKIVFRFYTQRSLVVISFLILLFFLFYSRMRSFVPRRD